MLRPLSSLSWRLRVTLAALVVLAGGVATGVVVSTRNAHAQLPKLTRIQRWEGSLQGCLANTTPEEKQKWPHWIHGCACLATVLVERCVPSDEVDPGQVVQCMTGQATRANAIMGYCSRNLNLTMIKKL